MTGVHTSLVIRLPFPPTLNHNTRPTAYGGRILTDKHKAFRKAVWFEWRSRHMPPLVGPLAVYIAATPPDRRKRDLDNLIKPVLDALQHAQAYKDDSQIDDLHIRRMTPDKLHAGAIVTIWQLT